MSSRAAQSLKSAGSALGVCALLLGYCQLLLATKHFIQHSLEGRSARDPLDPFLHDSHAGQWQHLRPASASAPASFSLSASAGLGEQRELGLDEPDQRRGLLGFRSTCEPDLEACSSLYFLSGVEGTVAVDLRFLAPREQEDAVSYFEDARFRQQAAASVEPFSSVDFFLSSVTDLNPNSVVTVKGSLSLDNVSSNGGTVMMVASEFTGNELWMYSDNDLTTPCATDTSAVVLGNSLNDGETVYTRTPTGTCSKLEMDSSVAPPLVHCQSGNYTWNLYSDFQCTSAVLASSRLEQLYGDPATVYCIAVGSGLHNASLQCVSSLSSFSTTDMDYDGSRDSVLPHFLQNDLPIIGGSGAGAVVFFLLLLLGLHKYQTSGFIDFAVGDVVIYKLTPAQQKRQRIQNLTKGYDYIKDRGFALVVSVPVPRFLPGPASDQDDADPDSTAIKQGPSARKSVLCLQPLRRVARPSERGPGHTDFFNHTQSPQQQQRRGGMGVASAAISLIREGEMELELTVDESQRPVSSNYWGIRGGRVLSVVPILWRRRIKLDVTVDCSEVEARRRKGRGGNASQRRGSALRNEPGSAASDSKLNLPRKLEMLSFLDVTYTTNPITGKGEWVSRASLAKGLRRRSPGKDIPQQREGELSPLTGAASRRLTMGKMGNGRDTKFERRETKRQTALKEKRSKRESVRRTILTADRKGTSDSGLWSLVRAAVFKNSMSEAERKRMTKIQDESIRISSMPRKMRPFAGRNDLAVLFGGKETGRKAWENVVGKGDEDEDDDEENEDWWKTNSYEAESMVLQPFLKSISRSETIKGRQSAAGIGFSFVIENCKELELDKVAYSVWNYPYSPDEEERALQDQEDEYFDSVVEQEPEGGDGFPLQEGDGSDEDDDDKYQTNDDDEDAGQLFELQPPEEEPSHHRHRMRTGTHQFVDEDDYGGNNTRGSSPRGRASANDDDQELDRQAYADFDIKSTQIRQAESAQRSQKKSRKLTHSALKEHAGVGSRVTPASNFLPSLVATPSPSSHLSRHVQQSGGAQSMQDTQTTPFQGNSPSPSRHQVFPHQNSEQHQHSEQGIGDYYVTPPHRMKSIVSRSTKVGMGQQVALSNDSTKSNSADKQYLMRVGDGLAVEQVGRGDRAVREKNESNRDRDRARHRGHRAEEHLIQQRNFAQDEMAYQQQRQQQQQQQQRGAKLGSSLEIDDDVDSAAIRRPVQVEHSGDQQQQQRQPEPQHQPVSEGPGSSSKKKKRTPGRSTIMAKEGADISQQAKQRRAERRRQRQEQGDMGSSPSGSVQQTMHDQMAVEDFD